MDEFGDKIHLFRDPTRGGVSSTLSEIADDTGMGILLDENDIPLDSQVAAACEMLGLDPLYVANEGVFLAIVSESIYMDALDLIRSDPKGKNASCIGIVTEEHPKKVVMKSTIGGKRMVSPLMGEQLPRIC